MIQKTSFMKKGFLFLFLFLLSSFILVSAQPPFQQVSGELRGLSLRFPPVDVLKQSQTVTANMHVYNSTDGLILKNDTVQCFADLYNFRGGHLLENKEMNFRTGGNDFTQVILGGNFSEIGRHSFIIWCNSTGAGGFVSGAFEVTPTGFGDIFDFYIIILLISAVLIIAGFWMKDPWVIIFGTFGLYFIGLYIMINGIVGIKDMVTTWAIALILLGVAAYLSFKAAQEVMNG